MFVLLVTLIACGQGPDGRDAASAGADAGADVEVHAQDSAADTATACSVALDFKPVGAAIDPADVSTLCSACPKSYGCKSVPKTGASGVWRLSDGGLLTTTAVALEQHGSDFTAQTSAAVVALDGKPIAGLDCKLRDRTVSWAHRAGKVIALGVRRYGQSSGMELHLLAPSGQPVTLSAYEPTRRLSWLRADGAGMIVVHHHLSVHSVSDDEVAVAVSRYADSGERTWNQVLAKGKVALARAHDAGDRLLFLLNAVGPVHEPTFNLRLVSLSLKGATLADVPVSLGGLTQADLSVVGIAGAGQLLLAAHHMPKGESVTDLLRLSEDGNTSPLLTVEGRASFVSAATASSKAGASALLRHRKPDLGAGDYVLQRLTLNDDGEATVIELPRPAEGMRKPTIQHAFSAGGRFVVVGSGTRYDTAGSPQHHTSAFTTVYREDGSLEAAHVFDSPQDDTTWGAAFGDAVLHVVAARLSNQNGECPSIGSTLVCGELVHSPLSCVPEP